MKGQMTVPGKWFHPEENAFISWPVPTYTPKLKKNVAHVWRASLEIPAVETERLRQILAADELRKAERFRFPGDRSRFIVARGTLRTILGGYLNMKPDEVRFCYGPFGKPELAEEADGETLRFSVSHSGGLALYAVTLGREIGVDLEYIRPDLMVEEIACQFLSPMEINLLKSCPGHLRKQAFFALWTRKEAYLKALGTGLANAYALCETDVDALWSFTDLHIAQGYAAAVAVEGRDIGLQYWQWAGNPV